SGCGEEAFGFAVMLRRISYFPGDSSPRSYTPSSSVVRVRTAFLSLSKSSWKPGSGAPAGSFNTPDRCCAFFRLNFFDTSQPFACTALREPNAATSVVTRICFEIFIPFALDHRYGGISGAGWVD